MVGVSELSDELKVLRTVDVSTLHELEVLLIHRALDHGRHCVREHVTLLSLLHQGLECCEIRGLFDANLQYKLLKYGNRNLRYGNLRMGHGLLT